MNSYKKGFIVFLWLTTYLVTVILLSVNVSFISGPFFPTIYKLSKNRSLIKSKHGFI